MELPTILYKDGGIHQRKNGTYSYVSVKTETTYKDYIANGWCHSLDEAINQDKKQIKIISDEEPEKNSDADKKNSVFKQKQQDLLNKAKGYGMNVSPKMPIGALQDLIERYESSLDEENGDKDELDEEATD